MHLQREIDEEELEEHDEQQEDEWAHDRRAAELHTLARLQQRRPPHKRTQLVRVAHPLAVRSACHPSQAREGALPYRLPTCRLLCVGAGLVSLSVGDARNTSAAAEEELAT